MLWGRARALSRCCPALTHQALQPPGLTWPWSTKESGPRERPPGSRALREAGGWRATPWGLPAVPLLSLYRPLKTHLEGWGTGARHRGRNRRPFPFPTGNSFHPGAGLPGRRGFPQMGRRARGRFIAGWSIALVCPAGHFVRVDFSLAGFFFFFSIRGRDTKHFRQLEFFPLG